MGSDPLLDDARHLLAWITRRGVTEFSRRQIFDGVRNQRLTKVTDVDPALALLIDHGWVQTIDPPPREHRAGRPPAPRYAVHPDAHDTGQAPGREPAQPAQPTKPPAPERSAGCAGSA